MDREQYLYEVTLKREDVPSFDLYPFSLNAVRNISTITLHPHVTFDSIFGKINDGCRLWKEGLS
jgi:predicted ATPase